MQILQPIYSQIAGRASNMKHENINESLHELKIPDFRNFLTNPYNPWCKIIDSTRLLVEIAGWLSHAEWEFSKGDFWNSLIIDGEYALIIHYKRESNNVYYPACVLSWDITDHGIILKQLQWSRNKSVAYRFHSTFQSVPFFLWVLEQSFFQKGIPVKLEQFPTWVEDGAHNSRAFARYEQMAEWLRVLHEKYYHILKTEQK